MCGLYPSSPSSRAFFFFLMIRPPPRSTLFPYPPLFRSGPCRSPTRALAPAPADGDLDLARAPPERAVALLDDGVDRARLRSEEHTSELQSRLHLVCRLLLEKKKIRPKLPRPAHPLYSCE